jgi:hypothetical protein
VERSRTGELQKACTLLESNRYIVIDADTVRKTGEGFELQRKMEMEDYRRYLSNPASYNHQ